jgi:hypothetical protein
MKTILIVIISILFLSINGQGQTVTETYSVILDNGQPESGTRTYTMALDSGDLDLSSYQSSGGQEFTTNKDNSKPLIYYVAIFLLFFGVWYVTKKTNSDKIKEYFKNQGFIIISEEVDPFAGQSWFGNRSRNMTTYTIKYLDRDKNIRQALVKTGLMSDVYFEEVHIQEEEESKISVKEIKSAEIQNRLDKIQELEKEINEYKKEIQAEDDKNNLDKKYTEYTYETTTGTLIIKQEFHNPNIGEKVFIYNRPAPNGKYKIGFLNFIEIEDGRIVDISSI